MTFKSLHPAQINLTIQEKKRKTVMTNSFIKAVTQPEPDTCTENGLPAFSSSTSPLVDLYYQSVRNIEKNRLETLLEKAWEYNPLATVKLIFQMRDCRNGKGDRDSFHLAYQWLIKNHLPTARKNLELVPEYGYCKDLIKFFQKEHIGDLAVAIYAQALLENNRLAFKYAPRPGKAFKVEAKILRQALGKSEKEYRQFLKAGTEVVEQLMCEHEVVEGAPAFDTATGTLRPAREVRLTGWSKIHYPSVPSKAMKKYSTGKKSGYSPSFARHDPERFSQFLQDVKNGKVSIKAGQLYPYELSGQYTRCCYDPEQNAVTDLQWSALVEQTKKLGFMSKAIPAVDVSGSMGTYKISKDLTAMDVAKSLGLLISEVTHEAWRDILISFSSNPFFFECKGDNLYERCQKLNEFSEYEGYSTNFLAVFRTILRKAKKSQLTQAEMPEMIIALSDCQFNDSYMGNETAVDTIKREYADAGYVPPILVFWNLNGGYNNYPATSMEPGVIMLSGFSPSALQHLLTKGTINPEIVVNEIINSPRYEAVTV